MNIFFQHINIFLVFAIAIQSLIFATIFIREKKGHAVRTLGLYEIAYFVTYFIVFLNHIEVYKIYIPASVFLFPLYALLSILFYLFIRRLARGKLLKTDWIHYVFPGLILITNLLFMYVLNFQQEKSILADNQVLNDNDKWQTIFLYLNNTLFPLLIIIQAFFYIALDFYEIYQLKKFIKAEFSYEEGINFNWALEVLILFSSFFILSLFLNNDTFNYAYIFFIAIIIGINSVSYLHKYYNALIEGQNSVGHSIEEINKYAYSSLSKKKKEALLEEINNYMKKEKKFMEPDLRLSEIAKDLNTNRQYISQVINEFLGENFYHFTNKYRINEFIRLHQEGQFSNLSIDGLAYKVGFKSKSSFYSAFKRVYGTSPKKYLSNLPHK